MRTFPALAALALLVGCVRQAPVLPRLELNGVPDGEYSVYRVVRNDTVLYRVAVTVSYDEELSDPAGAGAPLPTVVVASQVYPLSPDVFFFDSTVVVARRDSFLPIRSYRSLATDVSEMEVEARYSRGRASIVKRTVEGTVEDQIKLPAAVFVSDMMQTYLRAVPPVSGTSFTVAAVVPVEFRTVPVKVAVLGTKMVSTPVGDLMCREVVAITPRRELRYLYELEPPRRFVAMRDVTNETEMLLVEYHPGHPEAGAATP